MAEKDSKKPAKAAAKPKPAKAEGPASEAKASAAEETKAAVVTEAPKAEEKKKPAKPKDEAPAAETPKENLSLNPDDVEKPKIIKAKGSKNVHTGIAHVLSTFNNTIVTIT